ncbi:hypothetical protein POSPLADRAFT_1150322 [Postia placenta MAD-698-R-SB12]|uniref:Uncharacterized protein n=1 Tax=Postia placenta MAD-698-R-SB12 TaxID=670580 RepID=A0A1X6MSG1_9APHY|nr:hypothetical protein POSPLADRAFT_1150322 [Postia placenta MAD-698-R-SB12]OSX59200.1 hypothetical protein POSPLADRAFT_1150322 [Postia placenta MAD-698-R-SB12]
MSLSRALNFTPRQRRTFVSALFGLTFVASVITVSASNVLPCPAHERGRFADGENRDGENGRRMVTVVEKRPRRWIEETHPRQS